MHTARTARRGPWFWAHPLAALAVAAVLAAGIFVLRLAVDGVEDSICNLYVLPIALVALTSGRRAGLLAGVAAVALLWAWVLISGGQLTPLGWTSRIVPFVLLGLLVGDAADRIREAERTERHARTLEHLERQAAELHDSVMQQLAAAKWRIEAGDVEGGLRALTDAMGTSQALVGQLLGQDSVLPGDRHRSTSTR